MTTTTKTLLSSFVTNAANVRQAVADKLGMPSTDNLPEDCSDLAKGLGMAPSAEVVSYTTVKTQKTGLYLSTSAIVPGRNGGDFGRLGDPEVPLTPGIANQVREAADRASKVAAELDDLANRMADAIDSGE